MATGVTTSAELIQPEVWRDSAIKEALGKSVLVQMVDEDNTLVGQPGDTIHYPKFLALTDADDLTEGVAMVPEKLSTVDATATIKEIGKAVEITDTAELTSLGNPGQKARTLIASSIQRKLDADIRVEAQRVTGGGTPSSPIILPTVYDTLAWDTAITEAIGAFGDTWEPQDIAGIVIHSKQHVGLLRDPSFQSVQTFGPGATIMRGQVGSLAGGVPIFVSDRATKVEGATDADDYYQALVIRKGALSLAYKRRALVETDRDILTRTNLMTTNMHYAVKRLDDAGVIVVKSKG